MAKGIGAIDLSVYTDEDFIQHFIQELNMSFKIPNDYLATTPRRILYWNGEDGIPICHPSRNTLYSSGLEKEILDASIECPEWPRPEYVEVEVLS